MGLEITFVVYDLPPLLHPHNYPPGIEEMQQNVADVDRRGRRRPRAHLAFGRVWLLDWLYRFGPARDAPLSVGAFRLGADIERLGADLGDRNEGAKLLARMDAVPSAVMVGTVEPRKAIARSSRRSSSCGERASRLDLVIVGKKRMDGGRPRVDAAHSSGSRAASLLDAGRQRRDARSRLRARRASSGCSIASAKDSDCRWWKRRATELPIVARDLPVFREVAGGARSTISRARRLTISLAH